MVTITAAVSQDVTSAIEGGGGRKRCVLLPNKRSHAAAWRRCLAVSGRTRDVELSSDVNYRELQWPLGKVQTARSLFRFADGRRPKQNAIEH